MPNPQGNATWNPDDYSNVIIRETFVVLAAATSTPLLTADPNRLWLLFSAQAANTFVSTNQPAVANRGVLLSNALPAPLRLSLKEDGPIVQQPWFGFIAAGGNISVFTAILNRTAAADYLGDYRDEKDGHFFTAGERDSRSIGNALGSIAAQGGSGLSERYYQSLYNRVRLASGIGPGDKYPARDIPDDFDL